MKLNEDRLTHIAHQVWDALYNDDLVDYPDETQALQGIKKVMTQYFKTDDEIDTLVRDKISSLKRGVAEGSREWDILYRQYYEEEANRRRF